MTALLETKDVKRTFTLRAGMMQPKKTLHAVNGVSLTLNKGEVLGLVGESGCGKSTMAKMLLGLLDPTEGAVLFDGKPLHDMGRLERARRSQPIFQDPYSSLNPRKSIGDIISLPLRVHKVGSPSDWKTRTREIMDLVGLSPRYIDSYPNQLSGGQRQRVAIARALIMRPEIVICDEPTSALDVSVQSQILNLLLDLRRELGLTYILISHNLAVVEHIATRVAVMYLGRIVEERETEELFRDPKHPYTKALLASVLTPEPGLGVPDAHLGITFPNPLDPPPGCTFNPRCASAMPHCQRVPPWPVPVAGGFAECHLYTDATEATPAEEGDARRDAFVPPARRYQPDRGNQPLTELYALSAVELRRRIGTKEISPVELLESCIGRIEAVNPAVNAVTATCFDRARQEAKQAEAAVLAGDTLGRLHGLPIGVKDLQDTAGLRTTYGSPLFKDHVPDKDERMVAAIRAAGAIVVGKTNTPEWGSGANTRNPVYGATGNPFDPALICGGSSGGSAVALALDMMPIASGSDTGGSLRIPAAYCGVVGYRPSPGVIPSDKRAFGWTPISVLGPMARTVADTCLLMAAQVSSDSTDPLSGPVDPEDFAAPMPVDLGSLRVAYSEDLGFAPVDNDIRAVFRERIAACRGMFRECVEATPDLGEADRTFEVIRAVNYLGRYKQWYDTDPDKLGPNTRANYEQGAAMSLADFAWAHTEQTRAYRRVQQFYKQFDLLLTPVTPVTPFPWKQLYVTHMNGEKLRTYFHWLALTYGITLTGHPACAIPAGTDKQGMPFGLQVVGPHKGDRFTLGAAHALEQAFMGKPELRRPLPDIEKLRGQRGDFAV